MKLSALLIRGTATLAMVCGSLGIAAAQQAPGGGGAPAAPFMVHQLKPNVYWVEGGGGNSGVIVGNNGVIVVDAKTTPAGGKELLADIAMITPKPVTTVLITHSDGDHVNGLASFPAGVAIIAQENCKTEMQAAPNAAPGGALADHMPTRTVTKNMEDMTIEGVKLRVSHFAPAHTSGDLQVYLPDEKIMFTGDIVATQVPYALMHLEKNGTSDGWVATMNGMLKTDATTFVPGHGNVQMKEDLQKRVADTVARRDQIKMLAAQGKSLDEVRQALNEPPPAARPGGAPAGGGAPGAVGAAARPAFPNFQDFTAVIYFEATKK